MSFLHLSEPLEIPLRTWVRPHGSDRPSSLPCCQRLKRQQIAISGKEKPMETNREAIEKSGKSQMETNYKIFMISYGNVSGKNIGSGDFEHAHSILVAQETVGTRLLWRALEIPDFGRSLIFVVAAEICEKKQNINDQPRNRHPSSPMFRVTSLYSCLSHLVWY